MKKKRTPYLNMHNKFIKANSKMPYLGLCSCVSKNYDLREQEKYIFNLMEPTTKDSSKLSLEGLSEVYWGSESLNSKGFIYTERRQTIILLCAAINNEL